MNIESARAFLLWCAIFNYGVLTAWFLAFRIGHGPLLKLHDRWFALPAERFDSLHYLGMMIYKIGVLVFNVVPYFALCMVASRGG